MTVPSTRPYLIRALYDWCVDNGFTPYVTVAVNEQTRVPASFVSDAQITLNISAEATQHLSIDNDAVHFAARFGGVPMNVYVPTGQVLAIYARENGIGMAFPVVGDAGATDNATASPAPGAAEQRGSDGGSPDSATVALATSDRGKPTLTRIK